VNTVSGGFSGDLIQRRGGLIPGSIPQERCDVCSEPLNPADATEVTITTPAACSRLYGHGRCQQGLGARAALIVAGRPS
jgi:hypothetical protein